MGRRRRHTDGGEIALMAVTTKAMGAFLILMIFGFKYYVADMEGAREAEELTERLAETREAMARATDRARRGEYTEEEMNAVLAALIEAEEALAAAEALVAQLKARLDQALSAIRRLEEENARLAAENAELTEENAALAEAVLALTAEVEALRAEVAGLSAALAAAEQRLAEAAAEIAALRARNAQLEQQMQQLLARNAQLEQQLQQLQARNAQLEQQLQQLMARNAQLEAQNQALQQEVADLRAEVAWLREQLSRTQRTPPLLADYRYENCPGAIVRLSVARQAQRDPARPEPLIPAGDAVAWSPVTRGMGPDLPPGSAARFTGGEGSVGFTTMWLESPGEGERFALYLKWVNALPGGDLTCTGALSLYGRDARLTISSFEIVEARPTRLVAVLAHAGGALAEVSLDDAQIEWFHRNLAESPCDALACNPGAPAFREDALRLVAARLRPKVLDPGAAPGAEDIARGNAVLADLAARVVGGEFDLQGARRWTGLITINNRAGRPGEVSPEAAAGYRDALLGAGAPPPVAEEFAHRSLAGWWLASHARARLAEVGIGLPDAAGPAAPAPVTEQGGLPARLRPELLGMLRAGLIDRDALARWVEVFTAAGQAPEGERPEGRAISDTLHAMVRAQVPPPVIEAALRLMESGRLPPGQMRALLDESGLGRD